MLRTLLILLQVSQHYLLMQPLQDAVRNGRFQELTAISRPRMLLSLEEPLEVRGAMSRERFVAEFSARFAALEAEAVEWSSLQAEENIAVQSLNLILKRRFSGERVYYKLILFMSSEMPPPGREKAWQLYYVRGLRI
jgi:hypothetical protein